jgi:hypothetical protein
MFAVAAAVAVVVAIGVGVIVAFLVVIPEGDLRLQLVIACPFL